MEHVRCWLNTRVFTSSGTQHPDARNKTDQGHRTGGGGGGGGCQATSNNGTFFVLVAGPVEQ
ncbi:hypothetical protein ACLBR5_14235 [Escherichia coli]